MQGPKGASFRYINPDRQRALVVDRDASGRANLARYLDGAGFEVRESDGARGLFELLGPFAPDLVILDLEVSDERALHTCARVRGCSTAGIVLTTTPARRHAGILGLETGADDYLIKPVMPRELLARAHAILRRRGAASTVATGTQTRPAACYRFGSFTLSMARRELTGAAREPIALTGAEYRVLCALLEARGKVLPRSQLRPGGGPQNAASDHNIASIVYHLRCKLDDAGARGSIIGTVRSVGYVIRVRIEVRYE
jgi:DNA-binding response OmpR family regulator